MIKYYCDICGDEVENNEDLVTVGFFDYFLSSWSSKERFGDICLKCQKKIRVFIKSLQEKKR